MNRAILPSILRPNGFHEFTFGGPGWLEWINNCTRFQTRTARRHVWQTAFRTINMATKPPLQGCIQMPYRFKNLTTPGKGPSILSATIFEEGNVYNQNSLGICVGNQNAFKKYTKNPGGQSGFPKHVETNFSVLHIPGPRNFKALKRCSILKQMGLSCLDSLLSGKTVGPKRGGGNNLIQSTHVVWRAKNCQWIPEPTWYTPLQCYRSNHLGIQQSQPHWRWALLWIAIQSCKEPGQQCYAVACRGVVAFFNLFQFHCLYNGSFWMSQEVSKWLVNGL